MLLLYHQTDSSWFTGTIEYFFAPVFVAFVAYYVFGQFDERKKRKMYSLLGVELLSTLIEEIQTGSTLIKQTLDPNNNNFPNPLPRRSWNGINTISADILLRIYKVTNGIPDKGFPAKQIRIHTKNYFEYIVTNWDEVPMIATKRGNFKNVAMTMSSYDEATTKVLLMLNHVQSLLENNAKRWFPK